MFGDFLNRGKHGQLDFENIDDLEDGTPIVARYNNREFQFGIYGEGYIFIFSSHKLFNLNKEFGIRVFIGSSSLDK